MRNGSYSFLLHVIESSLVLVSGLRLGSKEKNFKINNQTEKISKMWALNFTVPVNDKQSNPPAVDIKNKEGLITINS